MSDPIPATQWNSGTAEWIEDGVAHLSVVFTWHLPEAYQRAAWYRAEGYRVRAGGPAVMLMPHYLAAVADINERAPDVLPRHNPRATRTSWGCPRTCAWCPVPRIQGALVEYQHWDPQPIVIDPNILATSRRHFDRVIDSLKPLRHVDFLQGLDARYYTKHHAQRIAELDMHAVRFAWDHTRSEDAVRKAISLTRHAGISVKVIKVYVLVGFGDTLDNALYRCNTLKRELGVNPTVMRYQPLDALQRDSYVDPHWTERQLRRFTRYWWRTRWFGAIPFDQFRPHKTPEDNMTIPDGYRTVREAAAITQTAKNTIYQWIARGLLPHVRHNSRIFVDVDAVPGCRQRDRFSHKVPPPLPDHKLVTVRQAHAISGVPVRTIQHYARSGRIAATKHNGIWYVKLADLTALAAA